MAVPGFPTSTSYCRAVALGVASALLLACSAGRHPSPRRAEATPATRIVLTDVELQRYRGVGSLLEALRVMRPVWLTSAGRLPQVSIDGANPTDISTLAFVPVHSVVEVGLRRLASIGRIQMQPNGALVATGDLLFVRTR